MTTRCCHLQADWRVGLRYVLSLLSVDHGRTPIERSVVGTVAILFLWERIHSHRHTSRGPTI